MPRKRTKLKIETQESRALKRMRMARGLSLKKAARKMKIHDTVINHYENGRANVTEGYIKKFLNGMDYTQEDWIDFLQGKTTIFDLREECVVLIKKLDGDKLKAIHTMLANFVK